MTLYWNKVSFCKTLSSYIYNTVNDSNSQSDIHLWKRKIESKFTGFLLTILKSYSYNTAERHEKEEWRRRRGKKRKASSRDENKRFSKQRCKQSPTEFLTGRAACQMFEQRSMKEACKQPNTLDFTSLRLSRGKQS